MRTIVHLSVMVLLVAALVASVSAAEKGPVAYWSMDEGQGNVMVDASGNGHEGTIHGATRTKGKVGMALTFDGDDDYVDCGKTLTGPSVQSFTVALWMKIESWDNKGGGLYIGSSYRGYQAFYIGTGTSGGYSIDTRIRRKAVDSEVFYSDSQWHHVLFVYDGSYAHLYKDGVEVYNQPFSAAVDFSGYRTLLGLHEGNNGYFHGSIDEVYIYDRALSEGEISRLYQVESVEEGRPVWESWEKAHQI